MLFKALLSIFLATLLHCPPQHLPAPPLLPGLAGKWRWEKNIFQTRGMAQAQVSTPASTGIDMQVHFFNSNTLHLYHNQQLVQTKPYGVYQTVDSHELMFETSRSQLSPDLETGLVAISGDTLTISGGYNDAGAQQTWIRVQ
ncbi:MAG: hypothetical protein IT260_10690 [Saprospiraceae bacterium]|nr:hypothetical protein [Saprospiraceae bacterium]